MNQTRHVPSRLMEHTKMISVQCGRQTMVEGYMHISRKVERVTMSACGHGGKLGDGVI